MNEQRTSVLAWAAENVSELTIAAAVAAGVFAALFGLRVLLLRAAKRLTPDHSLAIVFADVVRKTKVWFNAALSVQLVQGFLHPPQDVARTISILFTIAAALQVAIWARALILGMIERRTLGHEGDASTLTSAMAIIRLLVSITVFLIAGIVILDNLGVNVTALVAGMGIGGIAIGLAAQGIFSDLFAALSIIFDKPFRVGDVITYQGKEGPVTGRVKKIGLKSTRILSLTGEMRIIGNTQLLAQEVTNYTGRQMHQFKLPVGVTYQTDPAVAAEIPALMRAEVERAGHHFVRAAFVAFNASSIDFELLFDVETGDAGKARQAQQDVALGILRTFNERGIEFAYPTQTSFTAAPDGRMIMPYPEDWPSAADPSAKS
ncbi:MAG TPA: mechanosensitive ion channel family protein [Croceibacterium sp.]|nr:mechanosensitive ion channel family protein [Croceibacterium sp.]